MSGHTKGPWTVEGPFVEYLSIVIGDEPHNWRFVAHVHTDLEKGGSVKVIGKAQMEANARVIAASPDMLEALKDARPHVEAAMKALKQGSPCRVRLQEKLNRIDAAISKATGGVGQ